MKKEAAVTYYDIISAFAWSDREKTQLATVGSHAEIVIPMSL
jgi:hypothetical protein